jgi:TRAP transporter TAXI family solute receptor
MTRLGWILTILLGLIGLGIGIWQLVIAPKTYTLAVGPSASEDARLMAAFAQEFSRQDAPVRLRILHTENYITSAAALAAGKVDLAVTRSDIDAPANGSTIAVLRHNVAVVVAPANAGVVRIADLVGKRIGVSRGQAANQKLVETVLRHYEIDLNTVKFVLLQPGEGQNAFASGLIDVLFAVAPLEAKGLADAIAAAAVAGAGAPVFVPVREAPAIAQRVPALESTEILRGAFGGEPPRPAAPVPTLAVTHRLLASNSLSEAVVADITRNLFQLRTAVERQVPTARHIEAPDTERGLAMPTHPGAIAYLEGEQQTFVERYSDYLYLGAMLASLAASAGVAFWSHAAQVRRRGALRGIDRLLALLAQARTEHDTEIGRAHV